MKLKIMNFKVKKHGFKGKKGFKKSNIPAQKKRDLSQISPEVLFAQKLAANDPKIRNRAVKKLKTWLSLRNDLLTLDEILRIWKGLHYCFWMSDKPLVQEELAETISSFVHCFTREYKMNLPGPPWQNVNFRSPLTVSYRVIRSKL